MFLNQICSGIRQSFLFFDLDFDALKSDLGIAFLQPVMYTNSHNYLARCQCFVPYPDRRRYGINLTAFMLATV